MPDDSESSESESDAPAVPARHAERLRVLRAAGALHGRKSVLSDLLRVLADAAARVDDGLHTDAVAAATAAAATLGKLVAARAEPSSRLAPPSAREVGAAEEALVQLAAHSWNAGRREGHSACVCAQLLVRELAPAPVGARVGNEGA